MAATSTRRVSFNLSPTYSRPANEGEIIVAELFKDHIESCSVCYSTILWQGFSVLDPIDLCGVGRQLVVHIARHMFYLDSHIYPIEEIGNMSRSRIELPVKFQSIRLLLRAISYDRSGSANRARYIPLPSSPVASDESIIAPDHDFYNYPHDREQIQFTTRKDRFARLLTGKSRVDDQDTDKCKID